MLTAAAQGKDDSKKRVFQIVLNFFSIKTMKKKLFIFLLLAVSFPLSRLLASDKIPNGSYSRNDVQVTRQINLEFNYSLTAGGYNKTK